jgi:hypothetical protein
MTSSNGDDAQLLGSPVTVPEHVVERSFGGESVALNLRSGQYHGLNAVAARMLERLREAATAEEAVDPLATEFGQPREVIERDLAGLVRALADRGLVELG